jgi:hypothetical protein
LERHLSRQNARSALKSPTFVQLGTVFRAEALRD